MRKIIFNKSNLLFTLMACMVLTSCLKDKGFDNGEYGAVNSNVEGGKWASIELSGLGNFSKSSVLVNPASSTILKIPITIDLDWVNKTSEPVTVTLAIDNSLIGTYNSANGKSFIAATPDMVKLTQTTVTIPAGERTATTTLEITQNKFDQSKSYLFPVVITSATGGFTTSKNFNVKWFNVIGNPLAGPYLWTYRRYQQADTSGAPNGGGSFANQPYTVKPVNETTVFFPEQYTETFINQSGTGGFLFSFTNNNGVLSNFSVTLDAKSLANYSLPAFGFTLGSNVKIVDATIRGNAANSYAGSTFSFYIQWINSTGGIRTLVNTFTKL
ncbi:MAG TPA: DUF1735 domain-containing protein [Chitinophagaceae bacterium]|nr:DUF1735 domain-containing protein [Chitinophagaceae bacterium]